MEPLYNIFFAGEVMEGRDPGAVRMALGQLFKADEATLDKLFSGKAQSIKRNCDKATALKYKQAMEKAGARPLIKQADPPAERPLTAAEKIAALAAAPDTGTYTDDSVASEQAQAPEEKDEGDFDIAEAGADVLKPEERRKPVEADIDTGHLDVDGSADRLSEEPPPPPAPPDTSHLSMGEVGDDIPVLDTGIEPLSPDTDALSLSPEGTDFSDCAPPEPVPPTVDLSAIELAPGGSDVLEEKFRRSEQGAAPETDHIALED